MKYSRILLKLSGESLMGSQGYGIDPQQLKYYANEIASVVSQKFSVSIVIGGGNIFRGLQGASEQIDRVQGDYMGMLATLINSMALQSTLASMSIPAVLMSGVSIEGIAEKATAPAALRALDEGKVVIFAGGTGSPFFTTDTAAALRAAETRAEVLLKATRVDGVYTDDPEKNKDALKLDNITFKEAIAKGYKILDITAFTMCQSNNIPIIVFDVQTPGNLLKELTGQQTGTLIKD